LGIFFWGARANGLQQSCFAEVLGGLWIPVAGDGFIAGSSTPTPDGVIRLASPTSKEGGKPTVVASADFVGFNFRNSDVRVGAKATGGYTSLRWDGKRSYGILGDYTSALKGPNITSFYAWVRPKSIVLTSGTLTIGFEGNRSLYGTLAAGQMFNIQKVKNLKLLYMGTVSYGNVYSRIIFRYSSYWWRYHT